MKIRCLVALVLASSFFALAQDDAITLDDLLRDGAQWLQENIDPEVLRSLSDVDQEKVQKLFRELQQRFQGEYVIDLVPFKQAVAAVLPLLEEHEETQPYAAWLKARLDYFEVADQLRLLIPPPKVVPGQPPKPAPNPGPDLERKVWRKHVEVLPVPSGAAAYVSRLKPIFAAQKVPTELVWLAEVESSFGPAARSPMGAAGLFQIMPQTAKAYGLALRPTDERLQPAKSAAAAARYLKYLHGQFNDWPLALAAYNAGEQRVRNLLERHKARTYDQIATHLPAETQMYVPRVEATLARREGLKLSQLRASEG